MAYIYLLKFSSPIGSDRHRAQYYLGSTGNLLDRLLQHRNGQGAKIVEAALDQGIEFEIIRLWKFNRTRDARLQEIRWKRWKKHKQLLTLKSPHSVPIPRKLKGRKFGQFPNRKSA